MAETRVRERWRTASVRSALLGEAVASWVSCGSVDESMD